jgi:hypothetical protein
MPDPTHLALTLIRAAAENGDLSKRGKIAS